MEKDFPNPAHEKLYLYQKMMANQATAGEIMRLSRLSGMVSEKEYQDYLDIEKACEAEEAQPHE